VSLPAASSVLGGFVYETDAVSVTPQDELGWGVDTVGAVAPDPGCRWILVVACPWM